MTDLRFGDVTVALDDEYVATVEMHRPPENYFDTDVIRWLADAYTALDADPACRAILLCSEGKHFCAGANLVGRSSDADAVAAVDGPEMVFREATRMFAAQTPVVAAVQGAAVGAGLGLVCSADLRVACPEARFAANFVRLGFHHVFGLSATLPEIVGRQRALDLLYTGRRFNGEEAYRIGLCDRLVPADTLRVEAHALAAEIAGGAPLALGAIRRTMRAGLADRFRAAVEHEAAEQELLEVSADWAEGVQASRERRPPRFEGR
ncbi:MAG TPA: enoyl-CoA hydratase/isomerase family protein [Acidimicrobiia bacterium]|nr:enoyl-CoA hydratase/isomerase family protein [Acidimicrobiia bacterium]